MSQEISISDAKKRLKTKGKSDLVKYIISLLQEQTELKQRIAELEADNVEDKPSN